MPSKLKVMTIVGTRPEIIRLSRVIEKLDLHCDHALVHTGQNYDYELNEIFFSELGIRKPDHFLNAAGDTAAQTIGKVIMATDALLAEVQPDAVLVLGDTNSALSVIPAKRRAIPSFHMEAGNRCFDMRVPEEINRRIVDHTSDINLPYTRIAREYLMREGIAPETIITTGSPMYEVLEHYRSGIEASGALERLKLDPNGYYVVSAHREENVDSERNLRRLATVLDTIAARFEKPLVVSVHPRTRKRIEAAQISFDPRVRLLKPLGFLDYIHLQQRAIAVLSDSGTITEESSILNFPALNLREAHERPEGMEEGAVMMVGLDVDRVMQGLDILASQTRGAQRQMRIVDDYVAPNVSDKIVRIIHSYTDYVRRTVWKKY
jgi:UDP-N-acetylglucosamine 2-epimerase